ncbi:MAG: PKD domain-containing protein [Candidatus Lutacidiplasmatales archaeon]
MASGSNPRVLTIGLVLLGVFVLLLGAFPSLALASTHASSAPRSLGGLSAATGACSGTPGTCAVQAATASLEGHSTAAWIDLTNHSGTAPPSRDYGRSMAWDPATHYVLLFGGDEDTGYQNDTWAFENGTWTNLNPAQAPSGRDHGTLVWDPVDHYMLMFGGSGDGGAYNDTWTFSNGTWSQIVTKTAPSQRWSSSLVWDTADGYGLLFGGCAGAVVNDTWTYVGGVWTQLHPATAPQPIGDASMVYDPAIGKVLIFGGADWYANLNPNTWTYHAGNWTELSPSVSPPARTMASIAYDVALSEVILFGGEGASTTFGDQWAFTGSNWVQLHPVVMPTARYFGEFAWNGANSSVLLFSGTSGADTWAFYALNVTANATPTNGTAPLAVQLSSNVSGAQGTVSVVWQLGNGTYGNGSLLNVTYWQPGVYFPTAEVTDGSGAYATALVEIVVASPLTVNAFANPTVGPAPLNVLFGAAVSGGMPPDTLSWTVGGVPISSATNGSHVFPLMGNFVLQLSVRDTGGNTAVRTFHIAVGATPPPPLSVVYAGGPLVGDAPFNATFTDIANWGQGPYSPIWSFGDGSEASGPVSTHTFVAPGTYQVQVSVTDAVADFATALLNVSALPSLTTAVTASVQSGTAPLAVTFTATPTGGNGTAEVRGDYGTAGGAAGATPQTT